ncbi:MAG: HyaD/HybD family hydrogenase maturation endopeptidase [Dehalococcoidia bacterium]|nr:HyaD/HybD family hydrogenase maturation endopeptidase [Dehalococcoidia bacterium]
MSRKRVVIVGVGNVLLKDEGIGVHVARAIREMGLASSDHEVQVIDGGTSPDALDAAEGADKLIIVDAAQGGGEPGTVYRFRPDDVSAEPRLLTSLHDLGLLDSLRMMELIGKQPRETVIIAVEPAEIAWGLELTPLLKEKLPEIVRRVIEEQSLTITSAR